MDDSRIQDEIEVAQVVRILDEDCSVELRRLIKFEGALRRSEGVRVAASPIGPPAPWRGPCGRPRRVSGSRRAGTRTPNSCAAWRAGWRRD